MNCLKMMPGANKIKGLDKMQMSGNEIDHVQAIRSMTMEDVKIQPSSTQAVRNGLHRGPDARFRK